MIFDDFWWFLMIFDDFNEFVQSWTEFKMELLDLLDR